MFPHVSTESKVTTKLRLVAHGMFLVWIASAAIVIGQDSGEASPVLSDAIRPNVLFILADDHSYDSLHATGNPEIKTPNLDKLARQGVRFTRAYNMGAWNGAVCLASRRMLNTGRFLWRAEKLDLNDEVAAGRMWSQRMKSAGYETYFTGKWHVPINAESVFDHVSHVRPGMPDQTPEGYNRPIQGAADPWRPWDTSNGGYWKGGKHWSEVVADDTIAFLEQANQHNQPFFMYVAFNAPHDPRQSPKEFVDQYPSNEISVPANFLPEYPYKDAIGCGTELRDEQLAPFPRTEQAVQVNRQEYYAIITHMDQQIGRILDALEASGRSDNTFVFFTADHGLAVGHHGLMGKQNMYEHSMRVPFLVAGPGIAADKNISTPIYLQDVMPTTLALAGAVVPESVQFKNLLPLIRGQRDQQYQAIYGGYTRLQRMVTENNRKLILYPEVPKARLFDLENDPREMNDLAAQPEQQATMKSLFATLRDLQAETGDNLELEKTFPELGDMKVGGQSVFNQITVQKSGGFAGKSQSYALHPDGTKSVGGKDGGHLSDQQLARVNSIVTQTDWAQIPVETRTPNTADVFNYFVQVELPEKKYAFSIDELALLKNKTLWELIQLIEK
jgi:choline-sulfatase